jgi:hypothetical protein
VPSALLALFLGAVAAFIFVLTTRANSYNYIWLSLFLLLPCFGYVVGRLVADAKPGERFFPVMMAVVCLLVSLRDPLSLSLIAHDLPVDERAGPIFERLKEKIPPGDTVATTSRYWYLFQQERRNPWRVTAIYPHLNAEQRHTWVNWIVVPVDHLTEEDVQIVTQGFDLVEHVPSQYETFAPSFTLEDRTWAYDLYQRRKKE